MRTSTPLITLAVLLPTALSFACTGSHAQAGRPRVGTVSLHNTGDPAAQEPFLDGLAALHSFWYEEAQELFRTAQEVDPGFALAYWGEAMTHYRPIWRTTNSSAGRRALQRLDEHAGDRLARYGTEAEQALVDAARALFEGDGERSFSAALGQARERFPDSVEIAALYALSLQGLTSSWGQRTAEDQRLLNESGALLETLLARHPRHPGVLHYLIHAYDDPEHAAMALAAANTYTTVAPDASHALHMPSHIYVQVGDWDGVVTSNRRAWAASETWVERRGLADSSKDFHALSWLHYGLLQQGDFAGADAVRQILRENGGGRHNSGPVWQARRVIESENWEMELPEGSHREEVLFARAYAAAQRGDMKAARHGIEELSGSGRSEIYRLQLEGLVAAREGKSERAIARLSRAADLEEATRTPSGPPDLIKPALELFGEVALRLGHCETARDAFERSLARMPGRRLSLRGLEAVGSCSHG